jgi:acetyl-CoA carboxylase carboxyl transferase beta subunit
VETGWRLPPGEPASHAIVPWASVPRQGGELPPVPLPGRCPTCGEGTGAVDLAVCGCGHHFPMGAGAWVALLADAGSWRERWAGLAPAPGDHWRSPVPYAEQLRRLKEAGLNESVRVGRAALGGRPVRLAVFEFAFLGGTLGRVSGERLGNAMAGAVAAREPFLLVAASGGARMQEGLDALLQMPRVNALVATLQESRVLFVSILTGPTFGGTAASLALQADVNVAEPGAAIGFTGPRVITQATYATLPEGFQTAEFQRDHGSVDLVVPRRELRRVVAHLLDLHAP